MEFFCYIKSDILKENWTIQINGQPTFEHCSRSRLPEIQITRISRRIKVQGNWQKCNWSATNTRQDIVVGTAILSRHVNSHKESDWAEVKRIYLYLKHTMDKKLKLGNRNETENQLGGYVDADWGDDPQDRQSNGPVFKFCGAPISWECRKQSVVTASLTKAKYNSPNWSSSSSSLDKKIVGRAWQRSSWIVD